MKRREFITLPAKVPGWAAGVYAGGRTRSNRSPRGHGATAIAVLQSERGKGDCGRLRPHLSERRERAGRKEAGVIIYIDRQLAGPYGRDRYRYTKGPFVESVPEHGYQAKASPQEIYRDGLRQLGEDDFADLDAAKQDERFEP